MRYQTDNKYRKCVQGYGFMSFARGFGNIYGKRLINKGITAAKMFNKSKYSKALKNECLKFAKSSGKQILKRTAESTGDLIGNKIADKISSLSGKQQQDDEQQPELHEQEEIIIPPERRHKLLTT